VNTKRILSLTLALVLLIGVSSALAAGSAGSASDPLASLSYLNGDFAQNLLRQAKALITAKLETLKASAGGSASGGETLTTGSFQVQSLGAGSLVTLSPGGSAVLLSGSASVTVSGTVLNVSAGAEVQSGARMEKNARYLAAEGSGAVIAVAESSLLALDGDWSAQRGSGKASPFLDVGEGDWFFADVLNAIDMGFIHGKTSTIFDPDTNLTIAETLTLASSIHQLRNTGSITLSNGNPWYQPYVDYALANGLVDHTYDNYDAFIGRGEFVSIFFRTLPESEYPAVNAAADNSIPDVKLSDPYGREIYVFYRAGIITGYEDGWFRPERQIERSEIATLISRMFDPSARKIL